MLNMKDKPKSSRWRNYCLATVAITTNLAAVSAMVLSNAGNRSIASFEFPQYLPLDLGKATIASDNNFSNLTSDSQNQPETVEVRPEVVEAKQQYTYLQKKLPVSLKLVYLSNTRGEVASYISKYTKVAPQALKTKRVLHTKEIGHHIVFRDSDRAYLSSCISPRSPSSVDKKQFSQYRYQNDFTPEVLWQWLWGKSSIRDRRCLWVHLSAPIVTDSQTTHKALEATWQELYHWWLPNFPSL